MKIEATALPDVYVLTPARFGDERGFFSESWNRKTLAEAGLELPEFVQDNHSLSFRVGTVRGLHYQAPPFAQGNNELRVCKGSVCRVQHQRPPTQERRRFASRSQSHLHRVLGLCDQLCE